MTSHVSALCKRTDRVIEAVDMLAAFPIGRESVFDPPDVGKIHKVDPTYREWLQEGVDEVLVRGLDIALFQTIEQFYRDQSHDWARKTSDLQLPKNNHIIEKLVKRQFNLLPQGIKQFENPLEERSVLASIHSFSGDGSRLSLSNLAFAWKGSNLQFSDIKELLFDFMTEKAANNAIYNVLGLLVKDRSVSNPSAWRNHKNDTLEKKFSQLAEARHGAAHSYPLQTQLMSSKTNAPFVPLVCLSIDLLVHFAILLLDPRSNLSSGVQIQDVLDVYYVFPSKPNINERRVLHRVGLGRLDTDAYNSRARRKLRDEQELTTYARDLISRTKNGRMTLVIEISSKDQIRNWWLEVG